MSEQEHRNPPLLVVREETLNMSQLSSLGLDAAEAKMEQFNPKLFGYLYRLYETLPGLVAPVYNLFLLEYVLQRQSIPCVTDQTIKDYGADESNNMDVVPPAVVWTGLRETMLADKQLVLANTVDTYISILRFDADIVAICTHYGIRHMYFLLRAQAIEDRKPFLPDIIPLES